MRPFIFVELDEQPDFPALLGGDVATIGRLNEYTEPRPVLGTLGAARLGGDSLLQNDDREPHRAACLTYRPRRADELVQRDGFLDDVPLLLLGLGHAKPLQAVDVELIGKVRQDARGYRVHQVWQKFR